MLQLQYIKVMRCCPEHVCIYIQIYTHTTCNFFFTDEELLSHPWNTAMLEVMVQLTDDNPMSIATTLDMLQLVNMIAQNICCYSPVGRAGTSWNTLYWLKSFLRGSGVQNLKKDFKKFLRLNIYHIIFSYDDIPQHCRYWTVTLDTQLSQNLWRQCWLFLNFSKNKRKILCLHIFRISVVISSRRYGESIFQKLYY